MKSKIWIFFAAIGVLLSGWGIHQIFIIPASSGEQWNWLVPTPELIEYIKFRFQQLGTISLANGLFILGITLTGFRRHEQWAWSVLTAVPVYILLLTTLFYWLALFTIPAALLAAWALWAARPEKSEAAHPHGRGWILVFVVGLLLLYFAYDNLFVIPALDVYDPNRGWDWLTTEAAHIDYIKLYFRVYGIHWMAFAGMTLLSAYVGLRKHSRSAWQVLWLVPVLIFSHIFLWPWTAPPLFGVALLATAGLWLENRKPAL
jgi:hypothetical protein